MSMNKHPNDELMESVFVGYDHFFTNDLEGAKSRLSGKDDPYHLYGLSVIVLLEAMLGAQAGRTDLINEAAQRLLLTEARAKGGLKATELCPGQKYPAGTAYEMIIASTTALTAAARATSSTYVGYLQCMYKLNSGHSKLTKLYKTVFPRGMEPEIDSKSAPFLGHLATKKQSKTPPETTLFSHWAALWMPGPFSASSSVGSSVRLDPHFESAVDEFIVSGTSFSFGGCTLLLSLLPKKLQYLLGFLGYKHDRELALKSLAVSASKNGPSSVFAGLILILYLSGVLLVSGYQADEESMINQIRAIQTSMESRYPSGGNFLIACRALICIVTQEQERTTELLTKAASPERPHSFYLADSALVFLLGWAFLKQRKYKESAETFLRMLKLANWNHATYHFLAAGCYRSLGNIQRAQELLDAIPGLIEKQKLAGRELPTEVFMKKKIEFLKTKQKRTGGNVEEYAKAMKINVADELAIFWNNHTRIQPSFALQHVQELTSFTPPLTGALASVCAEAKEALLCTPQSPEDSNSPGDLDTPDELALRSLLLGINWRTLRNLELSRMFLEDAYALHPKIKTSTWIGGIAMFELAVLELKVMEAKVQAEGTDAKDKEGNNAGEMKGEWEQALKSAEKKLDIAGSLTGSKVDLAYRLHGRISMMKDEIATKRVLLGT